MLFPAAILALMENDAQIRAYVSNRPKLLYGVIFGPMIIIVLNNGLLSLRERFEAKQPDISSATLLLACLRSVVGAKRQRLRQVVFNNGSLADAIDPEKQICTIINEAAWFFGSLVRPKLQGMVTPVIQVTLVEMKNGVFEKLVYRYPEGSPIRSDEGILKKRASSFSKAFENPGAVIVVESTLKAVEEYHAHPDPEDYCCYVPGCGEHSREDKSQVCYNFAEGPEDCYCVAVTADAPHLYVKTEKEIYRQALQEFSCRIQTEMYFQKLKGARNVEKRASKKKSAK